MVRRIVLLGVLLASLPGCGRGPERVAPPEIDADVAAMAALETYDQNRDAALDEQELQQCPAMLAAMSKYDRNNDGTVAADEIAARIRLWSNDRAGVTSYFCRVLWNGRPLAGAKVEFLPEAFLGNAIKPASGQTRSSGHANMEIAMADLPPDMPVSGVHLGLYKVKITHPRIQIPVKYNEKTILGHEVTLSRDSAGPAEFNLKSN